MRVFYSFFRLGKLLSYSAAMLLLISGPKEAFGRDETLCYQRALHEVPADQVQKGIIGKMEAKLRTGVLAFTFEQTSEIVSLGQKESASGVLYLNSKLGKMKWEYAAPEKQFFLLDGKDYTFYQPSLNQASKGTLEKIVTSSLPLAFLVGKTHISSVFQVSTGCIPTTFDLVPNEADGVNKVILTIDAKSKLPKKITITDLSGNINEIVLTPLKAAAQPTFELHIPEGVDVYSQ